MEHPFLLAVAAACAIATGVWANSAVRLRKVARRAEREFGRISDVATVARSAFRKGPATHDPIAAAQGAGGLLIALVILVGGWLRYREDIKEWWRKQAELTGATMRGQTGANDS